MGSSLNIFRHKAQSALDLHQSILNFYKSIDKAALAKELTAEDIGLLKKLIIERIEILNSFELLCHASLKDAKEVLISRYLGKEVNPDTKFGGFEAELSLMLDDIKEIHGGIVLKKILNDREIDDNKLKDPRVQRAIKFFA